MFINEFKKWPFYTALLSGAFDTYLSIKNVCFSIDTFFDINSDVNEQEEHDFLSFYDSVQYYFQWQTFKPKLSVMTLYVHEKVSSCMELNHC